MPTAPDKSMHTFAHTASIMLSVHAIVHNQTYHPIPRSALQLLAYVLHSQSSHRKTRRLMFMVIKTLIYHNRLHFSASHSFSIGADNIIGFYITVAVKRRYPLQSIICNKTRIYMKWIGINQADNHF